MLLNRDMRCLSVANPSSDARLQSGYIRLALRWFRDAKCDANRRELCFRGASASAVEMILQIVDLVQNDNVGKQADATNLATDGPSVRRSDSLTSFASSDNEVDDIFEEIEKLTKCTDEPRRPREIVLYQPPAPSTFADDLDRALAELDFLRRGTRTISAPSTRFTPSTQLKLDVQMNEPLPPCTPYKFVRKPHPLDVFKAPDMDMADVTADSNVPLPSAAGAIQRNMTAVMKQPPSVSTPKQARPTTGVGTPPKKPIAKKVVGKDSAAWGKRKKTRTRQH
jgi:hypothetical protein